MSISIMRDTLVLIFNDYSKILGLCYCWGMNLLHLSIVCMRDTSVLIFKDFSGHG